MLKIIKDSGNITNFLAGQNVYSATLANGMDIYMQVQNSGCGGKRGPSEMLDHGCGWIDVDINGKKAPNVWGVDLFEFLMTKDGLLPYGVADMWYSGPGTSYFESQCRGYGTSSWSGYGCAAWVIYNENMDYLKCNDLSWGGKTKCD
jgi:hypothetical protein